MREMVGSSVTRAFPRQYVKPPPARRRRMPGWLSSPHVRPGGISVTITAVALPAGVAAYAPSDPGTKRGVMRMIRRVAVVGGLVYAGKWLYDNFVKQDVTRVPLPTPTERGEIPPIGE